MGRITLNASNSPFSLSATPSGGFGYFELDESSMIYGERVIQASGSIYVDGNEEKVQLMMMGQGFFKMNRRSPTSFNANETSP